MKKMIKLAMAVALTAFAVACSNQEDIPATNENEVNGSTGPTEFSIEGIINGYEETADSRAEAQTVVRVHWEDNDTVYVYNGTTYIGFLKAQADENNKAIAKLSGTLTQKPSSSKTLTLVYSPLFGDTAPTVTDNKLSLDLSEQNTADVPFLVYGVVSKLNQSVGSKTVNFQLATSVYKCNAADLIPEGVVDEARIDKINTKCVLTLSDNANPTVGGESLGTITRTAGFTSKENDERAIFAFALPKSESATKRTITIHKQYKEQTANFTNTAIAPAKSFNAVFAFDEPDPTVMEYVKIGGVRWAAKNLGAETVAESYEKCAGDFYQWGATELVYSSKWIVYNEYYSGEYLWHFTWKPGYYDYDEYWDAFHQYGLGERLYPAPGEITEDLLPDERDVVVKKLGDGWRLPTLEDYLNLLAACNGSVPARDMWRYGYEIFLYDQGSIEELKKLKYLPEPLPSTGLEGGMYIIPSGQTILPEYTGVAGMLYVDKANPSKRLFMPNVTAKLGYSNFEHAEVIGDYMLKDYEKVEFSDARRIMSINQRGRVLGLDFAINPEYGLAVRPVKP